MRKSAFLLTVWFTTCAVRAQSSVSVDRTTDFESTGVAVIKAFQKGDSITINKFIHPSTGIYFITCPGAHDAITHRRYSALLLSCD